MLLQAHLQRVVNGGGRIEPEYALGSGRVDLLIVWPLADRVQEFVVECKVMREHDGLESVVDEGVEQTARYVDRCAAEAGHLVVIDRRENRSWEEKIQISEGSLRRGRVLDLDPSIADGCGQLCRPRQVRAGQHLVAHRVGDRQLAEQPAKQIEFPRGGQPDQWTCVGRDEPLRHASTAWVSSRTVAGVPSTIGMPRWDTRWMNLAIPRRENRAA